MLVALIAVLSWPMVAHSGGDGFESAFFGSSATAGRSAEADESESDGDDSRASHTDSHKSSTDTPPKDLKNGDSDDSGSGEDGSKDSRSARSDGDHGSESTADSTESAGEASVWNTVDGTDVSGGVTYNGHTVGGTGSGDGDLTEDPITPGAGPVGSTATSGSTGGTVGDSSSGSTGADRGSISGTVTDDTISGTVYGISGTVSDGGVTGGRVTRPNRAPEPAGTEAADNPPPAPRARPGPPVGTAPGTGRRRDTTITPPHGRTPARRRAPSGGSTADPPRTGSAAAAQPLRCTRMVPDQQTLRAAMAKAVPHEVICLRSTGPTRPDNDSTPSTDVTITPVPGSRSAAG